MKNKKKIVRVFDTGKAYRVFNSLNNTKMKLYIQSCKKGVILEKPTKIEIDEFKKEFLSLSDDKKLYILIYLILINSITSEDVKLLKMVFRFDVNLSLLLQKVHSKTNFEIKNKTFKEYPDIIFDYESYNNEDSNYRKIDEMKELIKDIHNHYGIKNNHIGLIQEWKWKGCYLFHDIESNITTEHETLDDIQVLSKTDGEKEFEERNYNQPKNGEIFTDRQLSYGKIHDNLLSYILDKGTTGYYTTNYCMSVAHLISSYFFYIELIEKYGDDYNIARDLCFKDGKIQEIIEKYLMGEDSIYNEYCNKLGLNNGNKSEISESEILGYIEKIKQLPKSYSDSLFMSKSMDSPEMQYLLTGNEKRDTEEVSK